MNTHYIGPFKSENAQTGRGANLELRVESSETYPGMLDIGTYRWSDGEAIRLMFLDRDQVTKLQDALSTWMSEQPAEEGAR